MRKLFSGLLNGPRQALLAIDEKFGIEIFKLAIVFSTVYIVQGLGGLSNIPLLFYFKDVLKFSEDQMQNFVAITMLAWLIKPLFGYISDRFPIFGYKRKSYMVLMAIVAAFSWWVLAWMVANGYNQYVGLVLVFNLSSLGYAFVDVVCDGLMVERGQKLKKEEIFVNIQWFALGVAGFLAGIFGGQLQQAVETGTIALPWVFVIVGVIPLVTALIAVFFVKENRVKKTVKNMTTLNVNTSENLPEPKAKLSILKEVLTSKTFWILSAFMFFWKYSPSFGAIFQYYSIDVMKFDEIFLGQLDSVGYAIFPLSILLYAGMRKYMPWIKTKGYLYGSIVIGLIYSAISFLFYLPESAFSHLGFTLPFGENILVCWIIPLLILLIIVTILFKLIIKKRMGQYNLRRLEHGQSALDEKARQRFSTLDTTLWTLGKTRFRFKWIVILPLSMLGALWFANIGFSPLILSYRSLSITNGVIFGYASIASFLIPLALAARLAPTRGQAMTYAYFMALSNVAGSFLPKITGAEMFKTLKTTISQPETIANIPLESFLLAIAGIAALALTIILIRTLKKLKGLTQDKALFKRKLIYAASIGLVLAGSITAACCFGPTCWQYLEQLKNFPTYIVQRSYTALQPLIGNADWLGEQAYRVLILRYFTFIGAFFTVISTIFVALLKIPKENRKKH